MKPRLMDRIVFLDLDGVMNSHAYLSRRRRKPDGSLYSIYDSDTWIEMLDPKCVARLSRIVANTGCSVVLSSSWRHVHKLEDVEKWLRQAGFKFTLSGATPTLAGACRGDEIVLWLASHKRDRATFVILDDNSDMGRVANRLVQTSLTTGLTDADVERAIKMLREGSTTRSLFLDACDDPACPTCMHPNIVRAADRAARRTGTQVRVR